MQHPQRAWAEPEYASQPLDELLDYYRGYLGGRTNPVSPDTIIKYRNSVASFLRSLESRGEPLVLAALTPDNVNRWIADQRAAGRSEHGVASRLAALKAFSHAYIYKEQELTTYDLLGRVPRIEPKAGPTPELTEAQQERLIACYDKETFEDVRNRALIGCYLATGRRFREILTLTRADLDVVSGQIRFVAKGSERQMAYLSPRALRMLKAYLKRRPAGATSDRIWLAEDGKPLDYWGGQSIMRRLEERSGVEGFHCHVCRHNFTKKALLAGAERAAVQDMLGHKTDRVSRRYMGEVRVAVAARQMPKYAPI